MTVRFARQADIPALVEGGRRMHALTRFSAQPFIANKLAASFAAVIDDPKSKYVCMVVEGGSGEVVGTLIGVLEQHLFSNALTASVVLFAVLPEARMGGHSVRLLKAFEAWAGKRGVFEICFGVNSGVEIQLVGRFAQRMGYSAVGGNYAKGLQA